MQKFEKKRIISKIKRKFSSIFPSFWVENSEKFNRKISSRIEKWKLDKMHITAYCWNVIKIFCYFLEDKWYQCEGVRGAAESVTFRKFSRRCPLLAVETAHQIPYPSVTWKLNSMCSVCGTTKPSFTLKPVTISPCSNTPQRVFLRKLGSIYISRKKCCTPYSHGVCINTIIGFFNNWKFTFSPDYHLYNYYHQSWILMVVE